MRCTQCSYIVLVSWKARNVDSTLCSNNPTPSTPFLFWTHIHGCCSCLIASVAFVCLSYGLGDVSALIDQFSSLIPTVEFHMNLSLPHRFRKIPFFSLVSLHPTDIFRSSHGCTNLVSLPTSEAIWTRNQFLRLRVVALTSFILIHWTKIRTLQYASILTADLQTEANTEFRRGTKFTRGWTSQVFFRAVTPSANRVLSSAAHITVREKKSR